MAEAAIPLSCIEYAYGFGVYENVRVVRGSPLFLEEHLDRLLRSAATLRLEHTLTKSLLTEWTHALLRSITTDAVNLKLLLIGGRTPDAAELFILPLAPLFPDKQLYKKGATAITVTYERLMPQAKTLNMLGSYLAYRDAKKAGAYDALLLNRHDCVTEGTRTNFFGMKDRTIFSPPKEDILEGVTMMHVLDAAKQCRFSVQYEAIPLSSISSFDSVFLTSTSSKIMPLRRIDKAEFVISDPLKELMRAFDHILESVRA